jgi:2-dehydro-3-deoxy-D-arabinonate dehydratase
LSLQAGDSMYLTRHQMPQGPRWAMDGRLLPPRVDLSFLLGLRWEPMLRMLEELQEGPAADGPLLAPVDAAQEVWAAGVTYLRSREAREAESQVGDVYERVYDAERPELFPKAGGWRVVGHGAPVRIRSDSHWNVPEPELVIVINCHQEIVGYCAGNDVSSREIEGENPLYLPQAKIYDGSCALGPGIQVATTAEVQDLRVAIAIRRRGETVFQGETPVSRMKRGLEELVTYLFRELEFPHGVLLMTGTGLVPPDEFTLHPGDAVQIQAGSMKLRNIVQA